MFKNIILTSFLVTLFLAAGTIAFGGIPSVDESLAEWAYHGTETLSLYNIPDGTGHPFTKAFLPGAAVGGPGVFVDATITMTLMDSGGYVIPGFPFEDLWLESVDGGLAACPGGTVAAHNTDVQGKTYWAYPLFAGGWSESPLRVVVGGYMVLHQEFPLNVNSPDINGDRQVNLADVGLFSASYYGAYHYRADFNFDGVLNLSDVGYFASGLGAGCPW